MAVGIWAACNFCSKSSRWSLSTEYWAQTEVQSGATEGTVHHGVQGLAVLPGHFLPVHHLLIENFQLGQENRRLQGIQTAVQTDADVFILILAPGRGPGWSARLPPGRRHR